MPSKGGSPSIQHIEDHRVAEASESDSSLAWQKCQVNHVLPCTLVLASSYQPTGLLQVQHDGAAVLRCSMAKERDDSSDRGLATQQMPVSIAQTQEQGKEERRAAQTSPYGLHSANHILLMAGLQSAADTRCMKALLQ